MVANPPGRVIVDEIDDVDNTFDLGADPGFLKNLAPRRLEYRLAEFLGAARQVPPSLPRRIGAADQKNFAVSQDDGADADNRTVGIKPSGLYHPNCPLFLPLSGRDKVRCWK